LNQPFPLDKQTVPDDTSAMNETTMLGTYILEDDVPAQPEIVLADCRDTTMLGQLVGMFSDDPQVRFFVLPDVDRDAVNLGADFHFIKDNGDWVLSNGDHLHNVLFDDAGFNPAGHQATFSLSLPPEGATDLGADLPHDVLLVDMPENDIFAHGTTPHENGHAIQAAPDSGGLFIDPSVLGDGQHEIVVNDFNWGGNHLELPEHMSIKDVVVDNDHDLTSVLIGSSDRPDGDIVVRLPGVSHPDIPAASRIPAPRPLRRPRPEG
jgi:hypothetical protein